MLACRRRPPLNEKPVTATDKSMHRNHGGNRHVDDQLTVDQLPKDQPTVDQLSATAPQPTTVDRMTDR
jgi:hypothetical protein